MTPEYRKDIEQFGPLFGAVVRARTPEESQAACKALAYAIDADLDDTMQGDRGPAGYTCQAELDRERHAAPSPLFFCNTPQGQYTIPVYIGRNPEK